MSHKPPPNNRWSYRDHTGCGQHGYLRPCQGLISRSAHDPFFPMAPQCETGREMVCVVDDDDALRTEIVELVESLGYPATGFATAAELRERAPEWKSGCILLDVNLPDQDGIAVLEWLTRAAIALPVIFLSGVEDIGTVVHCMKSGAVEYLRKPCGEMALRRSISTAVALSRKQFCAAESRRAIRRMIEDLTPTELYVAQMIAKGYPTKLIAAEMGRAENTVKIHRHRIFQKLQVNSAASVANLIRHGEATGDGETGQVEPRRACA